MHISRFLVAFIGFGLSVAPASAVPVMGSTVRINTDKAASCSTMDQQELDKAEVRGVNELLDSLPSAYTPLDQHGCKLPQPTDSVNQQALAAQNAERALYGLPPYIFDPGLAQIGQSWANQLLSIRQPQHSPRVKGVSENVSEGLSDWSVGHHLQYNWVSERRYLKPGGALFPNACIGEWTQCGHESQIISVSSTHAGCGMAVGGGLSFLVCEYWPPGNVDGQPVGMPAAVAGGVGPAAAAVNQTPVTGMVPGSGANATIIDTNIDPPKLPPAEVVTAPTSVGQAGDAATETSGQTPPAPPSQLDLVKDIIPQAANSSSSPSNIFNSSIGPESPPWTPPGSAPVITINIGPPDPSAVSDREAALIADLLRSFQASYRPQASLAGLPVVPPSGSSETGSNEGGIKQQIQDDLHADADRAFEELIERELNSEMIFTGPVRPTIVIETNVEPPDLPSMEFTAPQPDRPELEKM